MCQSPVLRSRSSSHFFPPSVTFSIDIPIVRAHRAAVLKTVSHIAHKYLFPNKKIFCLCGSIFFLLNEKAPSYSWKFPLRFRPCAAHRWSPGEYGSTFFKLRVLLNPQRKRSKKYYVLGLERDITECSFVFSLSAVSKLHFHHSFLATARVSGSQHNPVCSGRCLGQECPGLVPLDGCQSAAANISRRKKGYFSSSFSLCQTWIEFHGTQKSIPLYPPGLFPC